jgi:hypothetical protein
MNIQQQKQNCTMVASRHFDKDQMSTQRRLKRGKYPLNYFFSPTHLQDDVLCFIRLDKHTKGWR